MLRGQRWLMGGLGLAIVASTTGCLSLGGRTTYVHEKPETLARISALETRVGALEQAFAPTPHTTTVTSGAITSGSLTDQ